MFGKLKCMYFILLHKAAKSLTEYWHVSVYKNIDIFLTISYCIQMWCITFFEAQ